MEMDSSPVFFDIAVLIPNSDAEFACLRRDARWGGSVP